jgi:hypothetical protein
MLWPRNDARTPLARTAPAAGYRPEARSRIDRSSQTHARQAGRGHDREQRVAGGRGLHQADDDSVEPTAAQQPRQWSQVLADQQRMNQQILAVVLELGCQPGQHRRAERRDEDVQRRIVASDEADGVRWLRARTLAPARRSGAAHI